MPIILYKEFKKIYESVEILYNQDLYEQILKNTRYLTASKPVFGFEAKYIYEYDIESIIISEKAKKLLPYILELFGNNFKIRVKFHRSADRKVGKLVIRDINDVEDVIYSEIDLNLEYEERIKTTTIKHELRHLTQFYNELFLKTYEEVFRIGKFNLDVISAVLLQTWHKTAQKKVFDKPFFGGGVKKSNSKHYLPHTHSELNVEYKMYISDAVENRITKIKNSMIASDIVNDKNFATILSNVAKNIISNTGLSKIDRKEKYKDVLNLLREKLIEKGKGETMARHFANIVREELLKSKLEVSKENILKTLKSSFSYGIFSGFYKDFTGFEYDNNKIVKSLIDNI